MNEKHTLDDGPVNALSAELLLINFHIITANFVLNHLALFKD